MQNNSEQKRNLVLFLCFLCMVVVLIAGCSQPEQQPVCNKPYILVGTDCCLDKDDNAICDSDETQAEEQPERETIETPQEQAVLSSREVYEQSRENVYQIITNCSYVFEYPSIQLKGLETKVQGLDLKIIPLSEKTEYYDYSITTGSGFHYDNHMVTNFHVIQCHEQPFRDLVFGFFEHHLDRAEKGELLTLNDLLYFEFNDFNWNVIISIVRRYPGTSFEDKLSLVTEHIYKYFLERAKLRLSVREIYAVHESSNFTKKIPLKVLEAGSGFPGRDYVLLSYETNKSGFTVDTDGILTGSDIFIMGYPDLSIATEEIDLLEPRDPIKTEPPIITSGIISTKTDLKTNVGYYIADAAAYYGSSGGPVINENGEVIGILTAGLPDIGDFTYILPMSEVEG